MSSKELNCWISQALKKYGVPAGPKQLLGSHSGKVTLLSWCSKFGLNPETRRKLGYHSKQGERSVNAYSRDLLAEPLRKLKVVEKAVGEGSFMPDATRSGYFPPPPQRASSFLLSRKRKLHKVTPPAYESPCGMASLIKTGYKKYDSVPKETITVCRPCFGDQSLKDLLGE